MQASKTSVAQYILKKMLIMGIFLVLSACSTHHTSFQHEIKRGYPVANLKKLMPQYVAVGSGQLEYYRFGSGPPLVLIAGYVSDVTSWDREFIADLAKEHEVIVFNNRNVAGSTGFSSPYLCRDLANDTHQLIKKLQLKQPIIVGISMGGMIAQQYAVLYPKDMSKLVLINTAMAGKAVHPVPATEKAMRNIPHNQIGRYIVAVQLFFPPNEQLSMAITLINERFLPAKYTEIDPAMVKEAQREAVFAWVKDNKTAAKIAKLNMPVLILNGEADIVIPPVNSDILHHDIAHSRLLRFKNGGHAMIYQYPESLATAINQFSKSPFVSGTKK